MSTPSDNISLCEVLSETRRILNANKKHFPILSLIFLLPLFILLYIYPTIFPTLFQPNSTTTTTPYFPFLLILYVATAFVLSIFAIGTITYSTFHGYYNQPLELIPTLKSLSTSFIPLCSNSIFLQLIISFICILVYLIYYRWLESNDTNIISSKPEYFTCSLIMIVVLVFVCVRYLQVNWVISNVIVVVESKWGYEPLRRSSYLMKGMEMIALKMNMFFGLLSIMFVYTYYWNSWRVDLLGFRLWIIFIFCGSFMMIMLMEYSFIATVVLYIYSKKMHGELGMEIEPEEYVSLNLDDDDDKYVGDVVHS